MQLEMKCFYGKCEMDKKKVLLGMLVICVASVVASLIVYSQILSLTGEEYQIFYVTSSSNEPTIMKNSYVGVDKTVTPSEIIASPAPDGDIIAFYNPRNPYKDQHDANIHRAIDKSYDEDEDKWYFRTKGDANPVQDSWVVSEDFLIGKVVNFNVQPNPLIWGFLFWITIIVAIATGVTSLILFLLIKKGKKTQPKRADYVV